MRRILILSLMLLLLPTTVLAQSAQQAQSEIIGADSLTDGLSGHAEELMEDYDPGVQADLLGGVQEILADAIGQSGSAIRSAMETMLRVLVILTLCQLIEAMGQTHSSKAATVAAALGVTACCAADIHTLVGLGTSTIEELSVFSGLLLPVMAAAAAASGAPVSASAMYGVAVFFSNLLINVCRYGLVPLVYAHLALATADAVLEQERLQKLRELLGWIIKNCLKGVMYAFTGFLTATGLLSGTTDAAALKTAKAAISSMVPLVGGIISGAADTVLTGAGLIKSAAGTFGMLAVLAVFALPFFRMGISYLSFKLTTALGGLVDHRHGKLLDAVTGTLGYMLAMTGSTALMCLLSCFFFLKAVTP